MGYFLLILFHVASKKKYQLPLKRFRISRAEVEDRSASVGLSNYLRVPRSSLRQVEREQEELQSRHPPEFGSFSVAIGSRHSGWHSIGADSKPKYFAGNQVASIAALVSASRGCNEPQPIISPEGTNSQALWEDPRPRSSPLGRLQICGGAVKKERKNRSEVWFRAVLTPTRCSLAFMSQELRKFVMMYLGIENMELK